MCITGYAEAGSLLMLHTLSGQQPADSDAMCQSAEVSLNALFCEVPYSKQVSSI